MTVLLVARHVFLLLVAGHVFVHSRRYAPRVVLRYASAWRRDRTRPVLRVRRRGHD